MSEMGAPDFFGAPTEDKRIDNQGRTKQEEPTGPKLGPAMMPSTDPEK